jgi:hypothetical protein
MLSVTNLVEPIAAWFSCKKPEISHCTRTPSRCRKSRRYPLRQYPPHGTARLIKPPSPPKAPRPAAEHSAPPHPASRADIRSPHGGRWLQDRSASRPRGRRVGDGDARDRACWQAADRGAPGADHRWRTVGDGRMMAVGPASCARTPSTRILRQRAIQVWRGLGRISGARGPTATKSWHSPAAHCELGLFSPVLP